MIKKKYLIISLFLIALIFITGCNPEKIKASTTVKGMEGTVDGTIYYTPGKNIYFSMRNNTDRRLSYSIEGTWEKSGDNEWEEILAETTEFPTLRLVEQGEETEAYGKKCA